MLYVHAICSDAQQLFGKHVHPDLKRIRTYDRTLIEFYCNIILLKCYSQVQCTNRNKTPPVHAHKEGVPWFGCPLHHNIDRERPGWPLFSSPCLRAPFLEADVKKYSTITTEKVCFF